MYVYALKLDNNKYYIGKTTNLIKRYETHSCGLGSSWTKKYKPIRIIEIRTCKQLLDELETTLIYMKKYGIDNVRGACFCGIELSFYDRKMIKKMIADMYDICYKCNKKGHFTSNCPLNKFEEKDESDISDVSDVSDVSDELDELDVLKVFDVSMESDKPDVLVESMESYELNPKKQKTEYMNFEELVYSNLMTNLNTIFNKKN